MGFGSGMLSDSQRDFISTATRTMQIIVASLVFGVVVFFAVVLVISPNGQPGKALADLLMPYIAAAAAPVAVVAWAVLPRIITGRSRQSIIEGKPPSVVSSQSPPVSEELLPIAPLVAIFQTRLIIGSAILEGTAFLNLIAAMLHHQQMNLIAAGALLLLLLFQIPSVSRVEAWVENEQCVIAQLLQMQ